MKPAAMTGFYLVAVLVWQNEAVADAVSIESILEVVNSEYQVMWWLQESADWNYGTNISASTASARKYVSAVFGDWMRRWKVWARGIDADGCSQRVRRMIDVLASGIVFADANDARSVSEIRNEMMRMYSSAEVRVPGTNETVRGEAEVGALMAQSRNASALRSIWKSWRIGTGNGRVRKLYSTMVQLSNKAARRNGYDDVGASWRQELGLVDGLSTVLALWEDVQHFYHELHSFARRRLRRYYGHREVPLRGPIPAHLLGSLWSENWSSLYDILAPYPHANHSFRFTSEEYAVPDVFRAAEALYTRMGFDALGDSFWSKSMFTKPSDGRLVDCHTVAYDFARNDDYRVKTCGQATLPEAVHEMGHLQYFVAYRRQPWVLRGGANSAFHEAIGDTMGHAARCLRPSPLLDVLMKQALSKFVSLPWALTVDVWRYEVFRNPAAMGNATSRWWQLRSELQGVEPPDEESSDFFDPGSKYHVVNNIPYMRYFLSHFLEHHFLESLCRIAKEEIHVCCFVDSLEAGEKLRQMLSLGAAATWQDALQLLTGRRTLSAAPLLDYYRPLILWLQENNNKENTT